MWLYQVFNLVIPPDSKYVIFLLVTIIIMHNVMKSQRTISLKLPRTQENLIATEAKLNKCKKSLAMTEKKNGELRFG